MEAKRRVDLLLPILGTSYSSISTVFERKIEYLEGAICEKFYYDNYIGVSFVYCKVKDSDEI